MAWRSSMLTVTLGNLCGVSLRLLSLQEYYALPLHGRDSLALPKRIALNRSSTKPITMASWQLGLILKMHRVLLILWNLISSTVFCILQSMFWSVRIYCLRTFSRRMCMHWTGLYVCTHCILCRIMQVVVMCCVCQSWIKKLLTYFWLQPFSKYWANEVTALTFQVTWRHRSCDHLISGEPFRIDASLHPSQYIQSFSRYWVLFTTKHIGVMTFTFRSHVTSSVT